MNQDKIDFVITWVDGNDPQWQKEKAKYETKKSDDARNIRYRDWDNLKYWFRGIEKFAPWVRKIHFVTYGHLPPWLNTENPKLNIVNHKDYIDEKFLPTFSSHPIELNMNKIEGLSEKFVYFNDDTFLIDTVSETDFFYHDLPVDLGVLNGVSTCDSKMLKIYYNNLAIINSKFKKKEVLKNKKNWFNIQKYGSLVIRTLFAMPWRTFIGFYNCHAPQPFLKSTLEKVWEECEEVLNETCLHKFRNQNDINQYLFRYWQLCNNKFYPRKYNFSKSFTIKDNTNKECAAIEKQKYKMICINDQDENIDFEKAKKEINDAFEKILPEKSSFEI